MNQSIYSLSPIFRSSLYLDVFDLLTFWNEISQFRARLGVELEGYSKLICIVLVLVASFLVSSELYAQLFP